MCGPHLHPWSLGVCVVAVVVAVCVCICVCVVLSTLIALCAILTAAHQLEVHISHHLSNLQQDSPLKSRQTRLLGEVHEKGIGGR